MRISGHCGKDRSGKRADSPEGPIRRRYQGEREKAMYETEERLRKKGKQAGLFRLSAVAAALVMMLPCHAEMSGPIYEEYSTNKDLTIDAGNQVHLTMGSGETVNFAVFAGQGKNISLLGNNTSITVDAEPGNVGIGVEAQAGSTVRIGNPETTTTMNIRSDGWIMGIRAAGKNADTQGASVVVDGKNLFINAESTGTDADSTVYALIAQNVTTNAEEDKRAELIVNAENTVINAKSAYPGAASGLVAMSQGILKVNGNLEVHADNAIVARGDAIVRVNETGNKIVRLNGNIDFNYDKKTSGTKADADVLVNLVGTDSYWNGNATVSYGTGSAEEGKLVVSGLKLGVSDGAQWNPTQVAESQDETEGVANIAINQLVLNDGVINIKTAGQEVKVDNLSGTGGTINAAAQKKEDGKLTSAKLQVGQVDSTAGAPHLAVNYQGINADDLGADTASAIAQLASNIQAQGATQTQTVAEGDVAGAVVAQVNEDGNVSAVTESANSVMGSLHQIAQNNFLVFRSQMNDMDKRMGDLRTMPQASGMWARAIAGQSEYKSMHNTYQTLQIGADHRIGNFLIGATASYTDGDGSLKNGSSDDKNYNFGLYGSWLGDDGQFVDVTLKRHHTQSDYDLYYTRGEKVDGSMHTSGTSLSVEYGRRFNIANTNYYLEPQAELMYGHLDSADYTTSNGVRISQDAIKSLVGRLGIAAGWVSPEKTGSAYIKASVLNDWEAESDIRASKDGISRKYSEDMGGTWGEFALGGTWNINKNFAAYGEVETTAGNPVRTTYQVSGGIRYSF